MKGNLARAFRRMGVNPTDYSKFDIDSMVSDHLEKAVVEFGGVKREVLVTNRVDRAGVFADIETDNQSEDSLTKAAIGRGFSYGSEAFPIEKSGKEIKEKLLFAIDYDNTEAAVSLA
ncbi:hypothetical protein EOM86_11905, partial [Candidatus Nomurabacteria bacterium]|nr:hypothetical protein [Candidatus Nomurabacteria bacterium]